MTTFDVIYCFFPVVFVICGTVTRSTRPVVDCGFKTNDDGQMRRAFHLSVGATLFYNVYFFVMAILYGHGVISLFVSHDCNTCSVTMTKVPCFTVKCVFFTFGVINVNCCRDVRQTRETAVVALLHNIMFVLVNFLTLPRFFKMPNV